MARPPFTLSMVEKNKWSGQAHEARLETTTGGVTKHNRPTRWIIHPVQTHHKHLLHMLTDNFIWYRSWSHCSRFTSRPETSPETYQYFPDITYTSLVICLSLVFLRSSSITDNHSITGVCVCCVVYYSMRGVRHIWNLALSRIQILKSWI